MKKTIMTAVIAMGLAFPSIAFAAGDLEISGLLFLNYTKKKTTDTNVVTPTANSMGMAIDRAYLSANYRIDRDWSAKVTLDAVYDAAQAAASKHNQVFLKNAYLQGRLADAATLDLGLINTPWVGYEQKLWKYRYISQVYVDRVGFAHSADAGIGVHGKVSMLNYHIAYLNGGGYSNTVETKGNDLELRVGAELDKNLTIDLGYRNGYMGNKVLNTPGDKRTLTQLMATFGQDKMRVGVNYVTNKIKYDNVGAPGLGVSDKATAYMLWGHVGVAGKYNVLGRYEATKTKRSNSVNNVKETRYLAGIEYDYSKNVSMSLAMESAKTTNFNFTANRTVKTSRMGLYTQANF